MIAQQFDSVIGKLNIDAVKIGRVCSEEIAQFICLKIDEVELKNVVIAPVEYSDPENLPNIASIKDILKLKLIPKATVATVNVEEASRILGITIKNSMGMKAGAKLVHKMGVEFSVVTGGLYEDDEVVDYFFDGTEFMDLPSERIEHKSNQGIGASFAAAIAAGLAHGRAADEAVAVAKMFVVDAAMNGLELTPKENTLNQLQAWWAAGGERGYGG